MARWTTPRRAAAAAAAIAWLDVLAISALTLVGPHAYRLAFPG